MQPRVAETLAAAPDTAVPRIVSVGQSGAGAAIAATDAIVCWRAMKLQSALEIVILVVSEAPSPVSVFVADSHGEIVAAATMDGAAPDDPPERTAKGLHRCPQRRAVDG